MHNARVSKGQVWQLEETDGRTAEWRVESVTAFGGCARARLRSTTARRRIRTCRVRDLETGREGAVLVREAAL